MFFSCYNISAISSGITECLVMVGPKKLRVVNQGSVGLCPPEAKGVLKLKRPN